ncbi:MAG TPA: TIGR04255 family protein [Halothiobacillus sp.]|nr:TIGR04255 family protein [Halothiobacillus sp.]
MGAPLKTPPVYLTLAQVRFNPILKLAEFLPAIQEGFRQASYPDFDRQQVVSIQLTVQGGQPPTPSLVQKEKLQFGNVERTHIFVLDEQSLALQSTNYGQFESFSACFLTGLNIVNSVVRLAFTERVGLRYLDRVMPQAGDSIEQYLAEPVHGLASRLGGQSLYAYAEAMNDIDNITLRSRVAIQDGPLAFPPDLQPGNLSVAERFASFVGVSAILDNDGFFEGREVFSVESVHGHLDAIHKVIGKAFRATATPYAFDTWDQ